MPRVRILLADARQRVRFGLSVLLGQQTGYLVAGEVADAQALLTQLQAIYADLLLLDADLPGMTLPELLAVLRRQFPSLIVIVLSTRPEQCMEILAAGADAFVSKVNPPEQLLHIVQQCLRARMR